MSAFRKTRPRVRFCAAARAKADIERSDQSSPSHSSVTRLLFARGTPVTMKRTRPASRPVASISASRARHSTSSAPTMVTGPRRGRRRSAKSSMRDVSRLIVFRAAIARPTSRRSPANGTLLFWSLHQKHRDHFGVDGDDVLVVQGPSTAFNPELSQAQIDAAVADDAEGARAEWEATFRSDLAAFLDDATI
jgi:hypothetical protein